MPFPIALAASLLPAAFQGIQGLFQKKRANDLQESKFIPPELLMNKDLATQQAYSRRAPGQAQAEQNIRRIQANQISASQRTFGGNANKQAAIAAGASAQADQANQGVATMGQQFSEGAFGRLSNANLGIAQQKRQNRDEFNRAKESLLYASDQNLFNGVNNAASAGLTAYLNGDIFSGSNKNKSPVNYDESAPTMNYNPWSAYQGNQMMQQGGFNPYNWGQQQYQNGGVWRMPGYSSPQFNMNVAPRMRTRMSSRNPY
jgi:hypothetical protein